MDVEQLERDAAERLRDQATSLTALLEQEEGLGAGLAQRLRESQERARRLSRAIEALEGVRKAAAPAKRKKSSNEWAVSVRMVDKIRATLDAGDLPEQFTVTHVRALTEHSSSAVAKALERMRGEGELRLAGQTKQNARIYARMPVTADA